MELGLALTPILSVCRWSRNLSFTVIDLNVHDVRLDERARQCQLLYSQGHAQLLLTPQPMLIIFLAVPSTGSLTMVKLCMECDNVPSKQSAGMRETDPHLFSTDPHASAAWRSIPRPDYCFSHRARIRQRSGWVSIRRSGGVSDYAINWSRHVWVKPTMPG